jgi:biopolymer transport protein ExbB
MVPAGGKRIEPNGKRRRSFGMKKATLKIGVLIVLLLGIAGAMISVQAQEAAAAPAVVASEGLTVGGMLKQGGWAMWPLGLFSSAMLFFIIRNAMLLRAKSLLRADLKEELDEKLSQADVTGARELCNANPSLMTSVLDAGLERISENDFDPAHVNEAIEDAGNEQLVGYMKSINYLSIIGATAPMLGLLGTVSGMIKAFQTISLGGVKPELLAGNIGEALITTAAGLIIAIPAMISYFVFKNNFIKNMSTMGRLVSHFMAVYRNALRK